MFLKSNVTDFSFLYDIFFLLLRSISLLNFFANLLFLNSLFFSPFIFLLNMTPGANSKKNADDITSNDRGEDEGIFCFLQSSILMHDFISFFIFSFFHFNLFFLPLSEESTLLCASLFSSCLGTTVIFNHNDYVNPLEECISMFLNMKWVRKYHLQGSSRFSFS